MRLHGDREPKTTPPGIAVGTTAHSGAANEVWSFGETAYEVSKKYLNIRENLKPYITELMQEAHEKGTPVMRPVFYDYPSEEKSWEIEDAYMFGPSLLVSPILYEGQTSKKVYLPSGETWIDVWSGQEFQGGQEVKVTVDITEIPIFTNDKNLLKVFKK